MALGHEQNCRTVQALMRVRLIVQLVMALPLISAPTNDPMSGLPSSRNNLPHSIFSRIAKLFKTFKRTEPRELLRDFNVLAVAMKRSNDKIEENAVAGIIEGLIIERVLTYQAILDAKTSALDESIRNGKKLKFMIDKHEILCRTFDDFAGKYYAEFIKELEKFQEAKHKIPADNIMARKVRLRSYYNSLVIKSHYSPEFGHKIENLINPGLQSLERTIEMIEEFNKLSGMAIKTIDLDEFLLQSEIISSEKEISEIITKHLADLGRGYDVDLSQEANVRLDEFVKKYYPDIAKSVAFRLVELQSVMGLAIDPDSNYYNLLAEKGEEYRKREYEIFHAKPGDNLLSSGIARSPDDLNKPFQAEAVIKDVLPVQTQQDATRRVTSAPGERDSAFEARYMP
eukprot:NODE_58_length_25774_cov_0.240545.p5 type:complete len:399 gc:universal NODE_58_length_25774_cov_0.240545:4229-3033(-)